MLLSDDGSTAGFRNLIFLYSKGEDVNLPVQLHTFAKNLQVDKLVFYVSWIPLAYVMTLENTSM